jgi:MFS family permease
MGLFSSSFIPVYGAMATLSNLQYGRAIGGFWTAALLGYATATLLGGILYQYESVSTLFLLGLIYGLGGTLVVLFAPKDSLTIGRSLDISRGYWGLMKQRNIAILCLLSITVLVSTSAFNSFFTIYLVDVLNGSRLTAGLAATGTTVLGVFAYRLVGPLNDKIGRKPVFMLGAAGYAAYFTILILVTNVIVVTVLWILPIYPLVQSAAAALMSDYTSAADRGKGLGLLESAISLGGGLGPLAGGLIADAAQLQAVIIFSLAIAFVSVASSQIFLKEKTRIAIPSSI